MVIMVGVAVKWTERVKIVGFRVLCEMLDGEVVEGKSRYLAELR